MAARPQLWRAPPQLVGVAVRDGEAVHDRKDPQTPTRASLDNLVQHLAACQSLQCPRMSETSAADNLLRARLPGELLPVHPFTEGSFNQASACDRSSDAHRNLDGCAGKSVHKELKAILC